MSLDFEIFPILQKKNNRLNGTWNYCVAIRELGSGYRSFLNKNILGILIDFFIEHFIKIYFKFLNFKFNDFIFKTSHKFTNRPAMFNLLFFLVKLAKFLSQAILCEKSYQILV